MKIATILIGILLLLCTFLFLDRSCTSHKLDIARNGYERQKIVAVMSQLKADEKISDLNAVIVEKDEEIESYVESIKQRDLEDIERERALEELEIEEIGLVDKDEIIVNLRSRVNNWRERFVLATNTIDDKDKIIFSLRARYDTQVEITTAWISKFNAERILRLSSEDLAKRAIKEASKIRFGSKLKTGGLAIIGGILLYAVLK